MSKNLFIGIMSGTSVDDIDTVLVEFNKNRLRLIETHTHSIHAELKLAIQHLITKQTTHLKTLGQLNTELGELYAESALTLISKAGLATQDIAAIGCHGQTVYHQPSQPHAFSLQLGSGSIIAARTQIDTVTDFRQKDIALGGQGAPLVPTFHHTFFASNTESRVILNIGGIANITYLASKQANPIGFDTGPGNTLLDQWTQKHLNKPYDDKGNWAKSGQVIPALLDHFLTSDYFSAPIPKSTGREVFNLNWLETYTQNKGYAPEDVQSTLSELTALSISNELKAHCKSATHIYLCGGGTENTDLIQRLQRLNPSCEIKTTSRIGLHEKWAEATAFAWLANQNITRLPGNTPKVTGATQYTCLGALYPGT